MMLGEFTAISEILKVMPGFAPTAYAWGKYESDHQNNTYFLLSDFLEMDTHDRSLPDPDEFCLKIAELHLKGLSPNGKFGFPVTTYHGRFSHFCDRWDESWATFMANLITNLLTFDQVNNGDWPELMAVGQHCVTHVIPRLLGVLQSDGRSIQPCLIHGDLWEGNIGTDMETGNIVVYDAGSFFAHHEFELGHWRCERHRISSKLFRKTYLKYYPASDPVEEFDDRNRLYSLPSNIMYATQAPGAIERKV
jgi:protein-ribulosamine 3-kinase